MPRTIVVIGGFVTDLVTVARRVPDPGETIVSDSFSQHPGGKGANSAVACYRLSHSKPAPINDARSNTETLSSQPAVAAPMQSAASPWGATTASDGASANYLPNPPTVVNGIPHEENPFAVSGSNTELPTAGIVDGVAKPQDNQREQGPVSTHFKSHCYSPSYLLCFHYPHCKPFRSSPFFLSMDFAPSHEFECCAQCTSIMEAANIVLSGRRR